MRKYKLNEDYFEKIDTEAKAYFLGYMVADGYVYSIRKNTETDSMAICLNEKDIDILKYFQKELETDRPIKIQQQSNNYGDSIISRLTVYSKKICSDLSKYGIVPNKTGNEVMPSIPNAFMKHFIRGFFDGDGTVFISRNYITVGFTSNENFLKNLTEFIHNELGLDIKNIYKESNTEKAYRLYYSRINEVDKIYNYLYNDATIYLERKKNKFKELLDIQNINHYKIEILKKYNDNFANNIVYLRKTNNLKQKELASILGVSLSKMNKTEKNSKVIDINLAKKISEFFNIDIADLIIYPLNEIQQKIVEKKEGFDEDIIKSLVN